MNARRPDGRPDASAPRATAAGGGSTGGAEGVAEETRELDKRPAYEPVARLLRPTGYDPDMPRPASIAAGAGLVLLRVVAGVIVLIAMAASWDAVVNDPEAMLEGFESSAEASRVALWILLGAGGLVLLMDLLFAVFVFRGHNWARVIVMVFSVMSISTVFFAWWAQGQEIEFGATFFSLALDILLLLALSSRSASAYTRRNERR